MIEKQGKYWCFPSYSTISPSMPSDQIDELIADFPDPLEHWIGFVCTSHSYARKQNTSFEPAVCKDNKAYNRGVCSPSGSQSHRDHVPIKKIKVEKNEIKKTTPLNTGPAKLSIKYGHQRNTHTEESNYKSSVIVMHTALLNEDEKGEILGSVVENNIDKPSNSELILEEQEDIAEEINKFVPAGSGSESSSKLRNSLVAKTTSPLSTHNAWTKEAQILLPSKNDVNKLKSSFVCTNNLRLKGNVKLQPDDQAPLSTRVGYAPQPIKGKKNIQAILKATINKQQ